VDNERAVCDHSYAAAGAVAVATLDNTG